MDVSILADTFTHVGVRHASPTTEVIIKRESLFIDIQCYDASLTLFKPESENKIDDVNSISDFIT